MPGVDVNLVLALDVSGSVNDHRWDVQRLGYARAFESDTVRRLILNGTLGAISAELIQWAGALQQSVAVSWMRLDSSQAIAAYAAALRGMERLYAGGSTSIAGAIRAGVTSMKRAPTHARKNVIDISGDGSDNDSYSVRVGDKVAMWRRTAVEQGIVINGLPILGENADVDEYYRTRVIAGPGCFAVTVKSGDDLASFTEALVEKLSKELVS